MSSLYFIFHPDDHPAQLKKVGNWVITFLSPHNTHPALKLMIRSVIPQQVNDRLQLRSVAIRQTESENQWKIIQIIYFDGQHAKQLALTEYDAEAIKMIHGLIDDFRKYDVAIHLKQE